MSNTSEVKVVTIVPACVNGIWYYRLYINQEKINDYLTMESAVGDLHLYVSKQKNLNDQRDN